MAVLLENLAFTLTAAVVVLGTLYRYVLRPGFRAYRRVREMLELLLERTERLTSLARLSSAQQQLAGALLTHAEELTVLDERTQVLRDGLEAVGVRLDRADTQLVAVMSLLRDHGIERREETRT